MTAIAVLLESDNININLEDKSIFEVRTNRIELNLSNTSEVSSPLLESLSSSANLNEKEVEISITDNKTTSSQEENKVIDSLECDEPKTKSSTAGCADVVNNENSSSQNQCHEKVEDEVGNDSKINKDSDKILHSNDEDDDIYASFKLNKKISKSNTKKKFTIVDSDSDDENIFTPKQQSNEETGSISGMSENTDLVPKSKKKSRLTSIIDSDFDDDSTNIPKEEKSQNQIQKPNNLKKLIDPDSEDDKASAESSENENDESPARKKKNVQKTKKVSSVIKDLVDSDDSEPDDRNINDRMLLDASDENRNEGKTQGKSEKKRKGSARASKDAAMQQIHSESQRLLRDSEVSLPYHRPKQRTLQEFLSRKKISSLPKAPTVAAKVKMFDDLIIKAVEEKEKEAEIFYKSSDSEEEVQLPNKHSDEVKEFQDSIDQNPDIRETEKIQMDVDGLSDENDPKSHSSALDLRGVLLSNNLNSSEQNDQVLKSQDTTEDKMTEKTHLESSVDKDISHVTRKLFASEIENEESSEITNHKSQKESPIQNVEVSNDPGNSEHSTAMETDTNDFALRFSTNDFDTNLNLRELESNDKETEFANKVYNEKSEVHDTEVNKSSIIVEEEKIVDDEGFATAMSKGHVLGLPPPEFDNEIIKKKTLKNKIPSYFLNVKPSLHGSPGTTIELSEGVKEHHEGVNKLVDRLVRHSTVSKNEENSDVTVIHTEVTADGLKIVEQVLPYKNSSTTEEPEHHKPGAKLQKLKEELQQKISSKRNEEWRQKEETTKALDEYLGHEIDDEDKDDLLADEEEELDDESAESEPEEDDVLVKENKKTKCAFADDEAEVSDDNDNDQDNEDDEEEEEEEEKEENEEVKLENDEEDDENNEEDEESNEEGEEEENADEFNEHPKKLRRITSAFEDDSNLSEPRNSESENTRKKFQRTKTDVDMFDDDSNGWTSDIEDKIRPQMIVSENPVCQTPLVKSNHLSLVSPITQLTVLNKNFDSAKKNSITKESDSLEQMNDSLSQESTFQEARPPGSLSFDKWRGLQKKLFEDNSEVVNDEELMDICSGNFGETPHIKQVFKPLMNRPSQMKVTESQLLDLCSGSFSSQPVDENSQDIKLTLDEESKSPKRYSPKKTVEVKSLGSRLKVVSSDEEDEITKEESEKKRKKKITKLILSDDDDEEEGSDLSGEENEQEEDEEKFVDYDSEENEVVIIPKKDIKKVAAKYVDAEAELSESDWDSADEDERGLDKLEREEGDDDEIDEDQMRNQLGKIHARQLLDDDQREVRLLQDMLFEDGDLHSDGAGRERRFKWKNIDKLNSEWDNLKASEDPDMIVDALEDTSELELRKHRYEKQKFLEKQEKESTDDIEEDLNDSQIFKFGLKIVKTSKSSFSRTEESLPNKLKKPMAPSIIPNLLEKSVNIKSSTVQYAMRGSFLARGEETLARIASMIDEKDKTIRAPLNSRRFVFEHISPSVKDTEEIKTDEEPSTLNKRSRKRTSASDSTPKSAKKIKVDEERSAGKKLFN